MKKILSWILAVCMLFVSGLYDIQDAPCPVFAAECCEDGEWRITGRISGDWDADCKTEPKYQDTLNRILSHCGGGESTAKGMRLLPGLIVRLQLECRKKENERKAAAGRREPACMRAVRTIYFAHGL